MKLTIRVKELSKKATLISVAFVLAVSTLTASVPFILSQHIAAAAGYAQVSNEAELKSALLTEPRIELTQNIEVSEKLVLSRSDVTINGGGKQIKLAANPTGWQGNYVLQVWNAKNVTINSLRLTGGDAGLFVNGSEVKLTGHIHVTGNEYGGIQVGGGQHPAYASKLSYAAGNASGNFTFANSTETATQPTIWTDHANGEFGNVSGVERIFKGLNGAAPSHQNYYYLSPQIANVVATNVTTGVGYASVEAATDAAAAGDVVRLEQNISLTSPTIRIRNAVTLEGNGKTITTTQTRGNGGVNNAAIIVLSSNVKIQNLTTTNEIGGQNAAHGIVVDTGKTGVAIENVTLKNGAAGVIINGSEVTIANIKTENNNWYGINVDKAGAKLSISGVNTHSEAAAIYTEHAHLVQIDVNGLYHVALANGNKHTYVPGVLAAPSLTSPDNNASQSGGPVQTWAHATPSHVHHYVYMSARDSAFTNIVNAPTNVTGTQRKVGGTQNIAIWWRVAAVDAAGNQSAWSEPRKLTIDNQGPAVVLNSLGTSPVSGTVTVDGSVADNFALSHYNLSLYNSTVDLSDGGTHSSDRIARAGWPTGGETKVPGQTSVPVSRTLDTTSLANGVYQIRLAAKDKAENLTVKYFSFEVNNPVVVPVAAAEVQGNAFTVKPTHLIVEFTPLNFSNATGVTIDLYDANNTKLASQSLAPAEVAGLVNGNTGPISSPFYIPAQADPYWIVDSAYSWTTASKKPAYAVVTVTDADQGAKSTTINYVDTDEASSATFASLIANAPAPAATTPPSTNPSTSGASTSGASDAAQGGESAAAATGAPRLPSVNGLPGELGVSDTNIPESTDTEDVKGISTLENLAQAVDANSTNGKALGLSWYWWLIIAAGAATIVWWIVAAARRRGEEA